QILFRLWQIEAGAVSTKKPGLVNRHLLALEAAGDPDHGDDNVRIFRRGNGRRIRRVVHGSPDELCCNLAVSHVAIHDIKLHRMSLLQMNLAEIGAVTESPR